ncbi:JAB domain-containing protein [Erwinia sp. E_sp_B01_3]
MESTVLPQPSLPLTSQRTIKRALTLLENHLREPGVAFTSTPFSRDWLRLHLSGLEREVFLVLLLDNHNRLLAHEMLLSGSINSTVVHPREIVKAALRHNAAAVILAHNYPSGFAETNEADRNITERLKQALALVDARLLDHLVVGSK